MFFEAFDVGNRCSVDRFNAAENTFDRAAVESAQGSNRGAFAEREGNFFVARDCEAAAAESKRSCRVGCCNSVRRRSYRCAVGKCGNARSTRRATDNADLAVARNHERSAVNLRNRRVIADQSVARQAAQRVDRHAAQTEHQAFVDRLADRHAEDLLADLNRIGFLRARQVARRNQRTYAADLCNVHSESDARDRAE